MGRVFKVVGVLLFLAYAATFILGNDKENGHVSKKQPVASVIQETKPEKEELEQSREPTSFIQITAQGGLGDTLKVLQERYGEVESEGGRMYFRNGNIAADFVTDTTEVGEQDLVWNIMLNFESTNDPVRSKEEAIAIAGALIPTDAVKIKERTVVLGEDYSTDIIEYKSELLAERVGQESVYAGADKGSLAIHLNNYTGNDYATGYFQVSAVTGNPEP